MLSYFFKRFRGGLFWQDFNLGLRLVELALVRSVLPPVPGVEGSRLHPCLVQLVMGVVLESGHELFVDFANSFLQIETFVRHF